MSYYGIKGHDFNPKGEETPKNISFSYRISPKQQMTIAKGAIVLMNGGKFEIKSITRIEHKPDFTMVYGKCIPVK